MFVIALEYISLTPVKSNSKLGLESHMKRSVKGLVNRNREPVNGYATGFGKS